jgi:cysteinyl-tRNA synthetase
MFGAESRIGAESRNGWQGMTLQLYNTLTKAKELFVPLDPQNVRMYVCGPTVYDYAHIGNARPVIVFDVLYRLLRHIYKHVTYVRNITDVDDKINARAAQDYPDLPLNEAIAKVTSETTRQFHEDIAALGVLEPDVEPTCTGHIPEMIAMIKTLIAKGNAYEATSGEEGEARPGRKHVHVLLDVASVENYGRLSRRSLDEMIAGARVEVAPYKKNPADSVLWKPSDETQPGWDSPWGRGRPGWHIECSAMAEKHLGETFDIHGGGIDLQFPHHENELAQSCAAHGTDIMAQIWMHNGFLQVEGQKMSKSLGNFITIHQCLTDWNGIGWPGEAIRLNMLKTHYRQPIDWTEKSLDEAHKFLWEVYHELGTFDEDTETLSSSVIDALSDDLNTPLAIAELSKLRKAKRWSELKGSLKFLGFSLSIAAIRKSQNLSAQIFVNKSRFGHRSIQAEAGHYELSGSDVGLGESGLSSDPNEWPKVLHDSVNERIAARAAARAEKNWAEADRIRDELATMGIQLKDSKNAETGEIETTWEVKR